MINKDFMQLRQLMLDNRTKEEKDLSINNLKLLLARDTLGYPQEFNETTTEQEL